MATVVCDQCGTVNSRPSRFCRNCDAFLDWSNAEEDDPPARGVPSQQPPPGSDRGPRRTPDGGQRPTQAPGGQRPGGQGPGGQAPGGRPPGGLRPGEQRPGEQRPGQPTARQQPGRTGPPSQPSRPTPPQQPIFGPPPTEATQPTAGRTPTQELPPAGSAPAPERTTTDPVGWLERSGSTCRICGTPNQAQRRYCKRCGSWLRGQQPAEPGTRQVAWWRRLFGLDERIGASLATRSAYRRSLSPTVRVARWLGWIAAAVVTALLLNVAGFNPVQRITDQIGHYRGWGKVALADDPGVQVTALATATPDGQPKFLVDDYRSPGWVAPWTAGTRRIENTCDPARPVAGPSVALQLPEATDIREIGLEAGLGATDKTRLQQWRPRTVELRWIGDPARLVDPNDPTGKKESDNVIQCQKFALQDDPALQRLRVPDEGLVTAVQLIVVDAYPPKGNGASVLTIGELSLWKR